MFSTKSPFFNKQSQFSKKSNKRKSFYNNELRTTNYELRSKKQSQFKAKTKPIQSQFKPNTNPIQSQTNPISEAKNAQCVV
jgi:hypothetical protein